MELYKLGLCVSFISVLYVGTSVGSSCDLLQASSCYEQLLAVYNATKGESRTLTDIVSMCTMSLKTNNTIAICYQRATGLCAENEKQDVESGWKKLNRDIAAWCNDACTNYALINECMDSIDFTAIQRNVPSQYCRAYNESLQCIADRIDPESCKYGGKTFKDDIFVGLLPSSNFSNYYQNVCGIDCPNLDVTMHILKLCYHFISYVPSSDVCPSHWKFTKCLRSFGVWNNPCDKSPVLMKYVYSYDFAENQMHCRVDACANARRCQSDLQRQYDTSLGYYVAKSQVSLELRDICLENMVGTKYTTCYWEYITDCTSMPTHPLRMEWSELTNDIQILCDKVCSDVMVQVPRCHGHMEYNSYYNDSWSLFCQSHRKATKCITELGCPLGSNIFNHLIKQDTRGFVETVCNNGCNNLDDQLKSMERCFPLLVSQQKGEPSCQNYNAFSICMGEQVCDESDDMVTSLFAHYTDLKRRCTTNRHTKPPTSGTPCQKPFILPFLVIIGATFTIL